MGNGVSNEPPEYYSDNDSNGEYDLDEPFEDRNCNEKWDEDEDGDEGNGIWDDDESYFDLNEDDILDNILDLDIDDFDIQEDIIEIIK